ncbi:uncharacterized protein [Littorina saxatilis]|uniref:Uncharacterized protein n=1 Tax=Littorina saxatilis TaxID=31220 RepID=A0AAN9AZ77_9CAEN
MESSSSDDDAIVPGVNQTSAGNLRPKVRLRRPHNVQTKVPKAQPQMEDFASATSLSVQDLSQSLDERKLRPAGGGAKRKQVSLKDLCVEDKQRIANLIKELAKVGEEREKAREELDRERRDYERQILKLVEQQEQILKERQECERHLEECQQILAQSQQFHLPPPHAASPLPPFVPPQPYPHPAPHQQWKSSPAKGQELGLSLMANVGSPSGHGVRDSEVALYRYQQQMLINSNRNNSCAGPPDQIHRSSNPQARPVDAASVPAAPYSQQHHQHHHHEQQQQERHQQQSSHRHVPHANVFDSAVQQTVVLDMYAGTWGRKDLNLASAAPVSSKEEIIDHFFASQPQDNVGMGSLKRRDDRRTVKHSGKGVKHGAFLPPIMSSTQKSTEIGDYLSVDSRQEYIPLAPDNGSPKSADRGDDDIDDDDEDEDDEGDARREEGRRGASNRVMFAEGGDMEQRLHSPSGDGTVTANMFSKMTQTQRKEYLLQQRAQLLNEQERLRHILGEQEAMLTEKQQALSARSRHHGSREEEEGRREGERDTVHDDDPLGLVPQRLAIDAALERQRAIVDSLEQEAEHRNSATSSKSPDNCGSARLPGSHHPMENAGARAEMERVGSGKRKGAEGGRGRENGPTQAQAKPGKLSDIVRKLDYSLHSDSEVGRAEEGHSSSDGDNDTDDGDDDDDKGTAVEGRKQSTPQRHDAGTSVSFRTLPRTALSPARMKEEDDRAFASSVLPPTHKSQTPGEKTMSVLEIINSLGSPQGRAHPATSHRPPAHHHHFSPPRDELSPFRLKSASLQQESSPSSIPYRELPPLNRWRGEEGEEDEIVVIDSSINIGDGGDCEGDESANEEELEESQILEDIFFVK